MLLIWHIPIILIYAFDSVNAAPTADFRRDLNVSALPNLPDDDFNYAAAYNSQGPDFSSTACIMAGVAAMNDLALRKLDEVVRGSESWTHPDYPGVAVSLVSEQSPGVTVRFAMWLIHAGVRDMMIRRQYRTAIFRGTFRDVKIGYSHFQGADTRAGAARESQPVSSAMNIVSASEGSHPGHSLQAASHDLEDGFNAVVDYTGSRMDRRDVFDYILYQMMSLCPRHNNALVVLQGSIVAVTVQVVGIWNAIKRPGGDPFVLRGGDMINMLGQMSVVILRDDRWLEMNVAISEGGTVIARGAIRARPLPRSVTLPVMHNVTIS
ncbi:MAG: hypothetical protein Q9183_005344 [Haloplaca sp. 2 TL-2023]